MNIKTIVQNKIRYEVGQLYNYLNELENTTIYNYLNAGSLINFYNLNAEHTGAVYRCVCPFHRNASNKTEFVFSDEEKYFHCFSCETSGTYLMFVALMEGFKANPINETKIFAANNFANINLGFNSINDYKEQIKQKVLERYQVTGSLRYKDYYDVSILPYRSSTVNFKKTEKVSKLQEHKMKGKDSSGALPDKEPAKSKYFIDIDNARNSVLLSEILGNKDTFNTTDELRDFMKSKYFIHGDIIEEYGLIYFSKDKRKQLTHTNLYGLCDRVLFPIKDHQSGNIVGFQGRYVFYSKEGKNSKYGKYTNIIDYGELKTKGNGYEYYGITPLRIGQFLFNLYETKNLKPSKLWITEGIADCIKLVSLGYKNVVSPAQSNLTDEQINLIKEHFGINTEILLFFDNDNNSVGQDNSISNSYKLWNAGFRNIKIVRTFPGQGTDITDVAVQLKDDNMLGVMINLWEASAYQFTPAKKEDVELLINSGCYTKTQVYQIDPRNIKNEILKLQLIEEMDDNSEKDKKVMRFIKGTLNINELNSIKPGPSIKDSIKDQQVKEPMVSNELIEAEKQDDIQSSGYVFNNISDAQLYRLKQRFDLPTIKKIDDNCTSNQIIAVVGNIINNTPFYLGDYLNIKANHPYAKVDESFTTTLPDILPF